MKRLFLTLLGAALLCGVLLVAPTASAQPANTVRITPDRGEGGLYQVGQTFTLEVELTGPSARLAIFTNDSAGNVHQLFPEPGAVVIRQFQPGTFQLPSATDTMQFTVQGSIGTQQILVFASPTVLDLERLGVIITNALGTGTVVTRGGLIQQAQFLLPAGQVPAINVSSLNIIPTTVPTTGFIRVRTNVPGATVFVNGFLKGVTDTNGLLTVSANVGVKQVAVIGEGFLVGVESVNVLPGTAVEVVITLSPAP
ncbi:MAG: DUF4384 domain-containing protein [Deinococcus sp.]|nr:DUF4384 domain-containing protein [Deinococcus sp.]